jgi:asparagine synthase (glutamine-hydrolysing)
VGQSYPNYLVAALASKSVKVVLSGAGGDELFAGYPWRYSAAVENVTQRAFRDNYFDYWNRLISRSEMSRVLAPIWSEVKDYDPRDVFDSVINQHRGASHGQNGFLNDCLYFEAKTFLHGLFVVEDKLSMAHSIETRLPFLDDEVVEFAMRCPITLKINKTDTQKDEMSNNSEVPTSKPEAPRDGKLILRKVLHRIAGNSVASRPKQGFSAPDTIWISNVARERLLPLQGNPTFEAIFDDQWIRDVFYNRYPSSKNQRLLLWSLSSVQTALNQFDL